MKKMLGKVDLLGLNSYGNNPGLHPLWGVAIGGGASAISSIVAGHAAQPGSAMQRNRELVGLGVGLATAGVMYAMPSTRHAAIGAAIGAAMASGLAWLEKTLLGTVQLPATVAAAASGAAAAAGTSGMGIANIQQLGIANMRQLGISNINKVPKAYGTIPGVAGLGGVAGLRAAPIGTMPANLLGAPNAASRQIALMGGPQVHNIASHYGATTTGGGR